MMMSELAAMMLSGGEGFYSSLSKMFFSPICPFLSSFPLRRFWSLQPSFPTEEC